MIRPTCKRCGSPLDFFFDPETGEQEWLCNNPRPIRTLAQHEVAWQALEDRDREHLSQAGEAALTWGPLA